MKKYIISNEDFNTDKIIRITMYLKPIFYEDSSIFSTVTFDEKTKRYSTDINPSRILNGPLSGPGEELQSPIKEEWESFIKDCKFLVEEVGFTIISTHTSEDSIKSEYIITYGIGNTPCGTLVYDLRISEHPFDANFPDSAKAEALEYLKMNNVLDETAAKSGIDFQVESVIVGGVKNDTWNRAFTRLYNILKRMNKKVKNYIISNESVMASSFNRVLQHMNETECCFITAFRSDYSTKENRRRNKSLYAEIKASGLSFIKANGGFVENLGKPDEREVTEETFCVINNQYTTEDFIKLACKWCGEFDQEMILITEPVEYDERKHTGFSGQVHIVGKYYNRNGNVEMEFDNVSMRTVEQYFTNIVNKSFVLSSIVTSVYTRDVNRNSVGRQLAHSRFTQKYNM